MQFCRGACLYNSTHCQCSLEDGNHFCLRPEQALSQQMTCSVEKCTQPRYKCDCLGSSVCGVHSCNSWKQESELSTNITILNGTLLKCYNETGTCVGKPSAETASPCIHNSTHCHCSAGDQMRLCLKFFSGSKTSALCTVDECRSQAFKCDCMGEVMCRFHQCGRWISNSASLLEEIGSLTNCSYQEVTTSGTGNCVLPAD